MSDKTFSDDVTAQEILEKKTPKRILRAYLNAKGFKLETCYDYMNGSWLAFVTDALAKGPKLSQYSRVAEEWHKAEHFSGSLEAERVLGEKITKKLQEDLTKN
ncbi:hypothetical protein PNOK_0706700 [Pyrrhoderma noxium]|uniref:Uncharacterized protein n=1 Tax=Pyrrhoderma noxium TaxID=2282107 RepID=A0A286UBN8_9AGAM|nr:hypothetical protein PNOK_0706700 [Pyrrhoderma noxium]